MDDTTRPARDLWFGPYRFDPVGCRRWHGDTPVHLGRKALAVLQTLTNHPGRLVTKEALLASAWPGVVVVEAVLTTAMRELRRALDDPARRPRFIETVH